MAIKYTVPDLRARVHIIQGDTVKKTLTIIHPLLFAAALLAQPAQAADHSNSIGMKFINISAGSFYMGSCKLSKADKKANEKRQFMGLPTKGASCPSGASSNNDASDDETPQHKVRISKGFQMGVYEVTLGQFKKFIAGAGRDDLLTNNFIKYNRHSDSAALSYASWNDAQAFIGWLNKKEGGNHYRLPTEAEWEYAARAGTNTIYSWGNSKNQAGRYAWYSQNSNDMSDRHAHAVGGKQPNPWGLYDMHGNVYEWVQDWHDDGDYYRNSPATDPKGASSGYFRGIRGGSWWYDVDSLRSANRYFYVPGDRNSTLGFRLVRQP